MSRVVAIWQDCRQRFAAAGPWLFGAYSAADAMFAPVALRFLTYDLPASGSAGEYLQTVLADAALRSWMDDAASEGVVMPADEAGIQA